MRYSPLFTDDDAEVKTLASPRREALETIEFQGPTTLEHHIAMFLLARAHETPRECFIYGKMMRPRIFRLMKFLAFWEVRLYTLDTIVRRESAASMLNI